MLTSAPMTTYGPIWRWINLRAGIDNGGWSAPPAAMRPAGSGAPSGRTWHADCARSGLQLDSDGTFRIQHHGGSPGAGQRRRFCIGQKAQRPGTCACQRRDVIDHHRGSPRSSQPNRTASLPSAIPAALPIGQGGRALYLLLGAVEDLAAGVAPVPLPDARRAPAERRHLRPAAYLEYRRPGNNHAAVRRPVPDRTSAPARTPALPRPSFSAAWTAPRSGAR